MSKLLKFEKENCPACTRVQNFLDSNNAEAVKINPFENPKLAVKYKISSVPVTILLDDDDNELQRSIGFKVNELEEILEKL